MPNAAVIVAVAVAGIVGSAEVLPHGVRNSVAATLLDSQFVMSLVVQPRWVMRRR